jgi:peptidoglycan/xylan/chitin deacetylase (PgdA/CDA1 family)
MLAALPPADQLEEIEGSKSRLEEILGRGVTSFAYPYGSRARADYTDITVELVRQTGFTCACSNLAQPVQPNADHYQLPRATVKDWSGDELARRLEGWFRG